MGESALATAPDFVRLFDLMAQVRALAPWDWIEEIDLFGVQDPETGEIGFVSIMGMGGEHFAIAVYRGEVGLNGFWSFQEKGPLLELEDMVMVPQLQASFEDREILQKRDADIVKALGLKFRGRNAWPMFRAYHRGYAPWFLESAEARFLAHALEQVLDIAPRYRENPDMLDFGDGDTYLVRVAEQANGGLRWQDTTMTFEPSAPVNLEFEVPNDLLEAVAELPASGSGVEIDFFMSQSMVGSRDERPYFPFVLMTVDAAQGIPLGFEMLAPDPTIESMWEQLGPTVIEQIYSLGVRPKEIRVLENTLLHGVLTVYSDAIGVKVRSVGMLPSVSAVRASMDAFLAGF